MTDGNPEIKAMLDQIEEIVSQLLSGFLFSMDNTPPTIEVKIVPPVRSINLITIITRAIDLSIYSC